MNAVLRRAALLLLLLPAFAAGEEPPRVTLSGTVFEGIDTGEGGAAFLGLPYAAPPLGDRRWAAPEPWRANGGTRSATRFAAGCLQDERMVGWYRELVRAFEGDPAAFPAPPFSEDCLYLNVWRPQSHAGQKLPVLVWIHGGSNTGGWSAEPNYAGKFLAREGLVVVSIAYRLGVFGFFSLPELDRANFALLDQIEALRWVRAHIAAFGGDPSRVTVAGESSGANNIAWLLASPPARGLFHRAVMQSGASVLSDRGGREEAMQRAGRLAASLGVPAGEPALERLRAIDGGTLVRAAAETYAGFYFDPVVDGDSAREPLGESVAQGRLAAVPLLIGTNADEWRMYLDSPLDETAWIREHAPGREASILAALGDERDAIRRMDRLVTARNFVCHSLALATAVTREGQGAWVYYFSRVREGVGGERLGAYHGAEIPYVFGTHDAWLPTTAADRELGRNMARYWAAFARAGNPGHAGAPAWPRFAENTGHVLQLDARIAPRPHPERALCAALATPPPA